MLESSSKLTCALAGAVTLVNLLGCRTMTLAANASAQCDVLEYYDVSAGLCRHCDLACFVDENGTAVNFVESRCLELCPGYIKAPRLPEYPPQPEQSLDVTLMEGGLFGFLIALVVICLIAVVIMRVEISAALKRCCTSAKRLTRRNSLYGGSRPIVTDTSYVKLADPSDEVEIIDRVTCV